MGKNSPDEVDEETKFFKYMYALRQDIDWVYEIVKLLEGISIDNRNDQSRDFGIAYVIKFLEKYCRSKDDYEFLLAAYGFLEGFTYIDYESCDERATVYWQYACKYKTHEFIKTRWGIQSVPASLRRQHKRIIGYLDKISQEARNENNGMLGLIEKVPKKLEFPKPRKIEETNDAEQEESQQNTADGGAGGQVKPYSKEQNGTGSKKLFQTIREKAKALIGFLKMRFTARDIIAVLILSFMAVGVWEIAQFLKSSEASPKPEETDSYMASAENEALMITGITIYNTEITLTPDKPWEKLRVSIYPREANIDDVNYYSDNIHLVTVNRNTERVRLAPEWEKQTEQSTKVHVQFEEIDAEALISVQESQDDSTASPGESSLGGNNSEEVKNTSGF